MVATAAGFWVESRYPALKRYHAGSQVKATGALSFGTWTGFGEPRSNGLDANRIGMTFSFLFSLFSFLFGPAALRFVATLQRRRTKSRYRNTLLGTLAVTGLVEIGDSAISDSGFRPRRGPA
jgi:hypothetical protein